VPASDSVIGVIDSSSALLNSGVAELTRDLIDKYPRRDDFHELLFVLLYETFIMGNQVSSEVVGGGMFCLTIIDMNVLCLSFIITFISTIISLTN